MKENIKKIINLVILIIIAAVCFVFAKSIPDFLIGKQTAISKVETAQTKKAGLSGVSIPVTSNTLEGFEIAGTKYYRLLYGNYQIYCAQKGGTLNQIGDGTKEWVEAYVNTHKNDTWDHKKDFEEIEIKQSYRYYEVTSTRAANNLEAYILTWAPEGGDWNTWDAVKQEAVWDLPSLSTNKKPPADSTAGGYALDLEFAAANYDTFATEIEANSGKMIKGDTTNTDEVKVNYTQSKSEYIVGPFSIDYVQGLYMGLAYGGITDMYIVDKNGDKIKLESIILTSGLAGTEYKLTEDGYFTPEEPNYVDAMMTPRPQYPNPNEKFYVKYVSTNQIQQLDHLHVDFEWMSAEATIYELEAYYWVSEFSYEPYDEHCDKHEEEKEVTNDDGTKTTEKEMVDKGDNCCNKVKVSSATATKKGPVFQKLLAAIGSRALHQEEIDIPIPNPKYPTPPTTQTPPPGGEGDKETLHLMLAGHVWEDERTSKETLANGIKDDGEKWKAGVEVILHYNSDGSEVARTVTDANGYYEFRHLNSRKKYWIEFIYDGQIYQATTYLAAGGENPVASYSNALEKQSERNAFNERFAEISSAPGSYQVRRALDGSGYKKDDYNTVYIVSKYSSEYCQKHHNHKEGKTAEEAAKEKAMCSTPYGIKEIYDYVINTATSSKSYNTAYNNALHEFGDNKTTSSKLQFIEDCRISSRTNEKGTIYPIYDNFIEEPIGQYVNGIWFYPLYPKHLNIDFGLVKRETFDLALKKDVEKATIEINGKSHTYTYDTLNKFKCNACGHIGKIEELDNDLKCPMEGCGSEDIEEIWDIELRLSDIAFNDKKYYDTRYTRELFAADYDYKVSDYGNEFANYGKSKDDELNVYVTYKLTVRNQSQSVLGEVMEIVDYYDEDFEYVDERSYIQIKYGIKDTDPEAETAKNEHLAMVGTNMPVNKVDNSKYGTNNETTIAGYDKLYIQGLQGMKLSSGQTAYIYLTFKVKKDSINGEDWIRLDERVDKIEKIGEGKENIAEINGFKTYYKEGTEIPNVDPVSGYSKIAGLFDVDSVPGNLNPDDVPKDGDPDNGQIKYENFEDDTDKAPNIKLKLYREDGPDGKPVVRTTNGTIWEDERNLINDETHTAIGNGIMEEEEAKINGVTVQLIELMPNGTEYKWKEFSSGNDKFEAVIAQIGPGEKYGKIDIDPAENADRGKYIINSYIPGNYVVRFIYGDTEKTLLPEQYENIAPEINEVLTKSGKSGQNKKSYNGQDYKSTTYQKEINQNLYRNTNFWTNTETNLQYIWREKSTWENGKEDLGEIKTKISTFKPDSSNNETANAVKKEEEQNGYVYDIAASSERNDVSDAKDIMKDDDLEELYKRPSKTLNSREDVIDYSDDNVMNHIAEVLASHEKMPLDNDKLKNELNELMKETQMTAETGLMVIETECDRGITEDQTENNPTTYEINHVNLGLEERPKAQLSVNKEVTNVKLTLADGSTLFDATQSATNALWLKHKQYEYKYNQNKLQGDPMADIRSEGAYNYDTKFGLIQLSMDEELMHGATIKISYKITVTNKGEVDFKENSFYYTGKVADPATIVKTEPNQLVDYVANNLQFYAIDNKAWEVIDKGNLVTEDEKQTLVNATLDDYVKKYNTVISTKPRNADGTSDSNIAEAKLVPEIYDKGNSSVSDDLILTQLITAENTTDDLTYRNIVELVRTSNDVGRRNAYSIVGNQDPTQEPQEVDTDRAEVVKILPPYGKTVTNYLIAITIVLSSIILIGGIIFIKKKVLK